MHPTQQPVQERDLDLGMTPADVARGAALYLARHGWTQGSYYNGDTESGATPPACLMGALAMAVYGRPVPDPYDPDLPGGEDFRRATATVNAYLADIDPDWAEAEDDSVGDWNDRWATSADEVITALNTIADEWDRQHPGGAR